MLWQDALAIFAVIVVVMDVAVLGRIFRRIGMVGVDFRHLDLLGLARFFRRNSAFRAKSGQRLNLERLENR